MKKNYIRTLLIVFGVLVALFVLANFGVNFWLKNNLPNYIKNNSDYKISYKTLDVDLGTGNILSTGVIVNSKNPQNQNVIGLDGTVDSLKISRLGIYDALFNKRINSSDLMMSKPNLRVTLAKPIDDKTGKKRNPMLFENIRIKDGNIRIFKHTKQKFVSVDSLNLYVENLQMTEESVEKKLPVAFDKYDINGQNFYFRPDVVYAIKAENITTKNGLMNIKNFQLIPLLSFAHFSKYYPQKGNLFDFKAKEMDFKDIVLKNNKVSLSNVRFENPDVKMYSNPKTQQKQKDFSYEINLNDVKMNNAKVQILKPNGNKIFTAGNLNLDIQKLKMDEETAKGNIPFAYEKFLIGGKDLNYITQNQDVKINTLAVNPKSVEARDIFVKPLVEFSKKPLLDVSLKHIYATVNSWKLENNKLSLDVQNVILDAMNGKFTAPENEERKKMSFSKLMLPLKVKNITLKNSNLFVDRPDQPLYFNNLYANVQNLEINSETVKKSIPLKIGTYTLTTKNFSYATKFYTLSAGLIKFQKDNFLINNFAMKPKYSRAQFIRMIPAEKDLYDIKVNQISGKGVWDLESQQKYISVSNILINGADANIFRSKVPRDDNSIKPMYSELLRKIKFPVTVGNLDIKNSQLVYEEDTKQSEGPGKLIFGNFNMNVKNLNSNKSPGKPTNIPITINCAFMNKSPMNVKWNFDTANMSDAFTIAGNISDLPAAGINPFIEPYLKIRATGTIQDLVFNFKGNKSGLNGSLNMRHKDLRVSILKKETGEKNKLLSALVNMVVKSNSGRFPESVVVDNVKRDPTKSFFNLFWQGIQEGLKKTLIGKNVEKTEASVKNTVGNTKTALETNKQQMQQVKQDVKTAVKNTKEKIKGTPKEETSPEKQGLFKRVFKKKEKAEE